MDPTWLIIKVMVPKGCCDRWDAMIGKIGVVSYHLQSFLELIILCAMACRLYILMLWLERRQCTNRGFDLLASLGK